jgi:DNA-binding response OmpR family regulator
MTRKLLVLDDDCGITTTLEQVTAALGYEVQVVNDLRQVISVCEAFRPDVLMFEMMPDLDGIDVLNDILSSWTIPRVILMSGLSESYLRLAEGVAAFYAASSVAVLRKPFDPSELSALLEPVARCGTLCGRPGASGSPLK